MKQITNYSIGFYEPQFFSLRAGLIKIEYDPKTLSSPCAKRQVTTQVTGRLTRHLFGHDAQLCDLFKEIMWQEEDEGESPDEL